MKASTVVRSVLLLLCVGLLLFSGMKLYGIYAEYEHGNESYEQLTDAYVSTITYEETTAPENELSTEETEPPETAPITVDFDALLAECSDVVGWLYCADTPINYPIVQSEDNSYYLRRLLDGSYNSSGSLFMDYRNAPDFSDWNSIVYGHNMNNDSMFGTLQDYKKQEYYDAHPVLYLLTPTQDYKIELIGGYTVGSTNEIAYGFPDTQEGRDEVVAKAREQSTFQAETAVQDGERLITLSTCAYEFDDARYVLVGVLKPLGMKQLSNQTEESEEP